MGVIRSEMTEGEISIELTKHTLLGVPHSILLIMEADDDEFNSLDKSEKKLNFCPFLHNFIILFGLCRALPDSIMGQQNLEYISKHKYYSSFTTKPALTHYCK